MASYAYTTVAVFTDQGGGGNPLAVFMAPEGLADAQMQAIARELNFSETTFVLPPRDPRHTAWVRIFTPGSEIPFAGHPNVGTAYVLAGRDPSPPEHYVFEEQAGLVRVHLAFGADRQVTGARVLAPQSLQIGDAVDTALVAACAGLTEADIRTDSHTPLVASVGTDFTIAEVADLAALARAAPDVAAFERLAEVTPRGNLHLYCRLDGDATRLRARMFAPLSGIPEDPATGSANATLAALLTSLAPGDNVELAFDIAQGVEMGRPSRLLATASKTAEGPVLSSIAGDCAPMAEGTITV